MSAGLKEVVAGLKGSKSFSMTLAALAGLASLLFVLVTPIRVIGIETVNGAATEIGQWYQPFFVIASALQAFSALCTISAAVLIATNRYVWAKRMLIAGALLGVNVIPVTTGLALAAFVVIRKMPDSL